MLMSEELTYNLNLDTLAVNLDRLHLLYSGTDGLRGQ